MTSTRRTTPKYAFLSILDRRGGTCTRKAMVREYMEMANVDTNKWGDRECVPLVSSGRRAIADGLVTTNTAPAHFTVTDAGEKKADPNGTSVPRVIALALNRGGSITSMDLGRLHTFAERAVKYGYMAYHPRQITYTLTDLGRRWLRKHGGEA